MYLRMRHVSAPLRLRDEQLVCVRRPVRYPPAAEEPPTSLHDANAVAPGAQDADGLSCSFSE
jgi:hypothetical protein